MLNEQSIRQISEGCGFKHRLLIKSSGAKTKKSKPRDSSIDKVLSCIKMHKIITKKVIMDKTCISGPCLESVFKILLDRKEIVREFIRFSGSYEVYRYSVVTES